MTGFFGRIFGAKKADSGPGTPIAVAEDLLGSLIELAGFDLAFDCAYEQETGILKIEFSGNDEELLRTKEGQLLDALQLYLKRAVQHQLAEEKIEIYLDVGGFREETNQALIDLADKLREIAISKGKTVYFRALPPKDRKIVHQYLAEDARVKSRSIGDGHFKKIKIYPVRGGTNLDGDRAEG